MQTLVILLVTLLFLRVKVYSLPQVKDSRYNQDVSFRALFPSADTGVSFPRLPFEGSSALAFDENNQCFLNVDDVGSLWASSRIDPAPVSRLDNPFTPWRKIADLSEMDYDMKFYGSGVQMIHGASSLVIAGPKGLSEFTVDVACSEIISYRAVSPDATWGDVKAITQKIGSSSSSSSSTTTVFVGTSKGAYAVDMATTGTPAVPIPAITTRVQALLYVSTWQQLLVSVAPDHAGDSDQDADVKGRILILSDLRDAGSGQYTVRHEWIGGNLDAPVQGFMSAPSVGHANRARMGETCVWMVQSESLHRLSSDGQLWRKGFQQGSITNGLTGLAVSGEGRYVYASVAAGGIMRYDALRDKWNYYLGERFLPGKAPVTKLASVWRTLSGEEDGSVMVASSEGMAFVDVRPMTLAAKAEAMHTFQYPRHDRYGLTAEASLSVAGDLTTFGHTPEDSDSIWTSLQVASASLRYAWHKRAGTATREMKDEAWRGFEGIERLALVSGVPGLVARSFCSPKEQAASAGEPVQGPGSRTGGCGDASNPETHGYPGSDVNGFEGWIWKGDTSSDTIDGHVFSYGFALDMVAETPSEKFRAYRLIDALASYILECDLYYVDITGERTKWGRWNPNDLNANPSYYSERGLNSVEILGYMALAYSVTGNETYHAVFEHLARGEPEYYLNTLNSKLDSPGEDNHSDNQLHFLAYNILFYAYARLEDDEQTWAQGWQQPPVQDSARAAFRSRLRSMVRPVLKSVNRWHSIVRREQSPMWLGAVALAARADGAADSSDSSDGSGADILDVTHADVTAATENLQQWAIDMVQWQYDTTAGGVRWDVVSSPYLARDDKTPIMRDILPPQERVVTHWNADPYTEGVQGSGNAEYAPCEWTLPYWLMVYYGVLATPQ